MHTALKHWFRAVLIGVCLSLPAATGLCAGGPTGEKPTFEQFLRRSRHARHDRRVSAWP